MMKAEVKTTKMLKELFIGNMTSLWELSGSLVDGRGGLLLLEERDDAGQVWTADRDMLKMSVCTSDIPGIISHLTSAAVTLRGVITDDGTSKAGEGAGVLKRGPKALRLSHSLGFICHNVWLWPHVASWSQDLSGETIADKI